MQETRRRPEISRRQALRAGALAGAAGAALTSAGCSTGWGTGPGARAPTAALSPAELDAFLVQFDRGLAEIERSEFVTRFAERRGVGAKTAERARQLAEAEAEFRDTVACIFASQSFRELPLESQLHPEVQRRMLGRIESIDASARRMTRRLRELTPSERQAFHQALRKHPDLSMDISEAVTREASRVGVSPALRRQFRSMMTHVAFRIKSQGPTRALDEITAHLDRISAPGTLHYEQAQRLALGDPEAFLGPLGALELRSSSAWSRLETGPGWLERWAADPGSEGERLTAAARGALVRRQHPVRRRSASGTALRTSTRRSPAPSTLTRRQKRRRSATTKIMIGVILFGLGLVVLGAGAITVSGIGLAFVFTPGVLAAATGLVLLLVGAGQMGGGQ